MRHFQPHIPVRERIKAVLRHEKRVERMAEIREHALRSAIILPPKAPHIWTPSKTIVPVRRAPGWLERGWPVSKQEAVAGVFFTSAGGGGGGATPDVDMNFSGYANTAALLADTTNWGTFTQDGWTGSGGSAGASVAITIDTAVTDPAVSSDRTMRYRYITGATPDTRSATVRSILPFGSSKQEVWAEFRCRFTSNFTTHNALDFPNDLKFIFGGNSTSSLRWALHMGMDGDVSSGTDHSIGFDWPFGGNWPASAGSQNITAVGGLYQGNRITQILANSQWDAAWHYYRIHIKHSTTVSSADGAYQMWIDGTKYRDASGFNTWNGNGGSTETSVGGAGAERLIDFSFCHNLDDGPANTTMDINWSRIRYYYSDPSWT